MRSSRFLLTGLVAFVLVGCDRRLYFPERVNTPLLQQAGDAVVTGSLKIQAGSDAGGRAATNLTPALDAAFSPAHHLGIMGAYRWQNNRQVTEVRRRPNTFGEVYNGHQWEAGAGYYTQLTGNWLFETYAGYGQGTTTRRGTVDPGLDFEAAYRMLFLQAAFCSIDEHRSRLFLGARVNRIRVSSVTGPEPGIRSQIAYGAGGAPADVTEKPAWTLCPYFGTELQARFVPLSVQVGVPVQVYGPTPGPRTAFYISLGAGLRYDKAFWQDRRGR